jgi:anhydro-N-acetylmuramic acid kinase
MNPFLQNSPNCQPEERLIVGLMSGTSAEAWMGFVPVPGDGCNVGAIACFHTVSYSEDIKAEIQSVFAKRQADLQQVCLLNAWMVPARGMVLSCCSSGITTQQSI